MVNEFVLSLFVFVTFSSGVLSQFTEPDEICPGGDVTFTCVVDSGVTRWTVSPGGDECTYLSGSQIPDTCGPDDRFRSSRTEGSETSTNSSLSVVSITEDLNGTIVECVDGINVNDTIGSDDICITGNASAPPFLAVTVTELNEAGCTLDVSWSEPAIRCGGSVSQYVLTVTPPTSDCQSSGDCIVMGGSSVITTPGTQTQYTFNVDVSQSDITVRADTCDGSLTGEISSTNTANLTGSIANPNFTYHYMYNIMSNGTSLDIVSIIVNWPRVLRSEADYRVIISNGSGVETTVDIVTADNCTGDNCSYTFSSDSITTSYSVAVVVLGCGTQTVEARNISIFCDPSDLLVPSVSWNTTAGFNNDSMGIYSFPGGNVTFDGVSLESTATYTTNESYLVNGRQNFTSRCGNDDWLLPSQGIVRVCLKNDLLPCSNPTAATADNMLCCNRNSLCSTYTGLANGSIATYTTSQDYCIMSDSLVERTCGANMSWNGETPTEAKASRLKQLITANIVLMVLGLLFFLAGVVTSIVVVVKTWPDGAAKEDGGNEAPKWCCRLCILSCCCPCWIRCFLLMMLCPPLLLAIVLPVLEAILWIATFIYVGINDFTVDGGDYRNGNSLCESPSGINAVRDGLFSASFVISLLIFMFWLGYYPAYLMYKKCCSKPEKPDGAEEPIELGETYDVIQRNTQPTQKLLSDVDPAYKKLEKRGAEEPAHYGKLDHAGKKTATVAPAVGDAEYGKLDRTQMEAVEPGHYGKLDRSGKKSSTLPVADPGSSEYGKLDRTQMQPEEPGHYGKLDHSGKKTNTLPVADPGSSEYGKLDRSQMEDPLHYGKLDHPGKRGATLPGGVAPTDTEGYGKLDNTQMQAGGSSARGGDMYHTVSHEPRHKVPSSKSKRQHSSSGEEASLL